MFLFSSKTIPPRDLTGSHVDLDTVIWISIIFLALFRNLDIRSVAICVEGMLRNLRLLTGREAVLVV